MNWTFLKWAACVGAAGIVVAFAFRRADGRSEEIRPEEYEIVASAKEAEAATELQEHLQLISGFRVPIVEARTSGKKAFLFENEVVGKNPEAIEWRFDGSSVVFRGHACFAVTDFLENGLGVRWPEGDEIACRTENPIRLKVTAGEWSPELAIRGIRGAVRGGKPEEPAYGKFCRRMRKGIGRTIRDDAPPYGHAFTQMWSRFGKTHPEYFALRSDGLRGPWNAKKEDLEQNVAVLLADKGSQVAMCCTSTGLVEQIVRDWIANGKPRYINLCENDVEGKRSCQCPDCKALDVVPSKVDPKWETHYADRYVYFANQVLKAAKRIRPDVQVCYYAYNATQDAPRKQRPDPATVIGLVPTYFTEAYVSNYIASWRAVGVSNYFYRPNRHYYYRCSFIPVGFEKHFFDLFREVRSAGALGFDYDAPTVEICGFGWHERYILYHAMQDPSKSFDYWESHYCEAFGAAAADIAAYYRYWREEVWEKRIAPKQEEIVKIGRWFNFAIGLHKEMKEGRYVFQSDYDAAETFLRAAEARNLSPSQRELVRRLRDRHEHAVLYCRALIDRSRENSAKLAAFRKAHGMPRDYWFEDYYGDLVGMKEFLGKE